MSDLPDGMTERDVMRLIVWGVRRFVGHQVIGFGQAWTICSGFAPDDIDDWEAAWLCWLLDGLGYQRTWVAEVGHTKMQHLWTREPWPRDFGANLDRDIQVFLPMS